MYVRIYLMSEVTWLYPSLLKLTINTVCTGISSFPDCHMTCFTCLTAVMIADVVLVEILRAWVTAFIGTVILFSNLALSWWNKKYSGLDNKLETWAISLPVWRFNSILIHTEPSLVTEVWPIILLVWVINHNNEPRHEISNNLTFWQEYTQMSLCRLFLSLETPKDVQSVA